MGSLVVEQAFALASAVRFPPVLQDGASAHNLFDHVSAVHCAVVIVVDVPSADPEV
jgi:hypothetical protein